MHKYSNLILPLIIILGLSALLMIDAQAAHPSAAANQTLLSVVPKQWQARVKQACNTLPSDHPTAGIYYSNYVDASFKLLILQPNGQYSLMYWTDTSKYQRSYAGRYTLNSKNTSLIELDFQLNESSLGSDASDLKWLLVAIGQQQFLLQNDALADIGRAVQWGGTMGQPDRYQLKVNCQQSLSALGAQLALDNEGPNAPLFAQLPAELQAVTFAKPVMATITALIDQVKGYDASAKNDEFLVEINQGTDQLFRMNMPLCSPKKSGQSWLGWVGDPIATNKSQFRVVINPPRPGQPRTFPRVGDRLSTSRADCYIE